MKPTGEPVRVVFRRWRTGNRAILALFPDVKGDTTGRYCLSYERQGQHATAYYAGCVRMTDPASPRAYAHLARELRAIGYTLQIDKGASS